MLSIGNSKVSNMYHGDTECKKAYLNDTLVFDGTPANPSRLPAGYTEVEYILFDEHSAIDSGLKVTPSKLKIEIDMESTSAYSSGAEFIVSNKPSQAGYDTSYNSIMNISRTSNNKILCAAGGGTNYRNSITYSIPSSERISLLYNGPSKKLTIGDTTATIAPLTVQLKSYPLNLGYHSKGTASFSLKYKLYSAKIYSSSTKLARDFVPCIDPSGVVGLYDLVNGKFYSNALAGTFTVGPAV